MTLLGLWAKIEFDRLAFQPPACQKKNQWLRDQSMWQSFQSFDPAPKLGQVLLNDTDRFLVMASDGVFEVGSRWGLSGGWSSILTLQSWQVQFTVYGIRMYTVYLYIYIYLNCKFHRWVLWTFGCCIGKIMMLTRGSSLQLSLAAILSTWIGSAVTVIDILSLEFLTAWVCSYVM